MQNIPVGFIIEYYEEKAMMIMLTKLNKEKIMLNSTQIESVEFIPESKITMMNGRFFIVEESAEEIIKKAMEYSGRMPLYIKK